MNSSCVGLNLKDNLNFLRILNWNFFLDKWPNWISMNWKLKLSRLLTSLSTFLFLLIFFLLSLTAMCQIIYIEIFRVPVFPEQNFSFIFNQLHWWNSLALYLISSCSSLLLSVYYILNNKNNIFERYMTLGCILVIKCKSENQCIRTIWWLVDNRDTLTPLF